MTTSAAVALGAPRIDAIGGHKGQRDARFVDVVERLAFSSGLNRAAADPPGRTEPGVWIGLLRYFPAPSLEPNPLEAAVVPPHLNGRWAARATRGGGGGSVGFIPSPPTARSCQHQSDQGQRSPVMRACSTPALTTELRSTAQMTRPMGRHRHAHSLPGLAPSRHGGEPHRSALPSAP
jgi:hypothetical protein